MKPDDRTYWRSLEQLADDPEVREFMQREFPPGAAEPPAGVTRREMIQLLGASLSLAGLAACRRPEERIVPYVDPPAEFVPGIPVHYATTLPMDLDAYGVVVTSHEGRPTKIEGNELHPATAGKSSAWMQASILDLYDPDRAREVRQDGEPRTWDDFVTAWTAIDEAHSGSGGEGLAVLVRPWSSPTLARLGEALARRLPRARLVAWEPLADENALAGIRRATGRPLRAVPHFERAEVVLSLDADPLLTDGNAVRNARGFAEARRVRSTSDDMNRLWSVEGPLTLTGANADHRIALKPSQMPVFLAWLAWELFRLHVPLATPLSRLARLPHLDLELVQRLAADLAAHRGRSLLVAGRRQPPLIHAAVHQINAALGNVGRTVTLHPLADARPSSTAQLADLVAAMRSGEVRTLVVLGANPVYDTPADLGFTEALGEVPQVVVASSGLDETARRASWHVPLAHPLETWGDARSAGGVPSVIQPLIAPLYGGKSEVEVLGLVATGQDAPGWDRVRETWRGLLDEGGFEAAWARVLHDGVYAAGAAPAVEAAPVTESGPISDDLFRAAELVLGSPSRTELVFLPSGSTWDGRWANNGWLQEMPDPITKLTWENAALLAPATAASLGVGRGDVVRVGLGQAAVELPVLVVPGQADGVVAVELGWGRTSAGRVGSGRGADAGPLRATGAAWFVNGVTLEPTGERRHLATTQDHHVTDELGIAERAERVPTLIRESTLAGYRADPDFARAPHPPLESLWEEHRYDSGHQWGMSIDLNVCTGCSACVVACQSENNIPVVGAEQVRLGREMHWLRVDRYYSGEPAAPQTVFQPVPCMHCENAPCEQVCPVAATVHDSEGLNTMVYNRCIGTRYCSNNCPYKVRRFNFFNFTKDTPEPLQLAFNPDVTVRSRGVMEKCTYCTQRINAARIQAKLDGRPLADGDVRTACQQACPADAISFGDLLDRGSEVVRRKGSERDYTLLVEMNNKPRTTYLAKLRNPRDEAGG